MLRRRHLAYRGMVSAELPRSPATANAASTRSGPVIAVIGPRTVPADLLSVMSANDLVPVALPPLHPSTEQECLGALISVLACDAVVLVLPAEVGLDPGSSRVWRGAAEHGMPRSVLVVGLGAATADLEELSAIVARALEEEPVLPRLPVLADDEVPAGSMDLITLGMTTPDGPGLVEPEHLAVVQEARAMLVEAIVVLSTDDVLIDQAMSGLQPSADRLAAGLAEAVASGNAVTVLPVTPDMAAIGELARWWRDVPFVADRLVPVDAHGDPAPATGQLLAVVLGFDDPITRVRVLRGGQLATHPVSRRQEAQGDGSPAGSVLLTRVAPSPAGHHGQRSWPTWMASTDALFQPGEVVDVRLPLRTEPGEALCVAPEPVWLVP